MSNRTLTIDLFWPGYEARKGYGILHEDCTVSIMS